MKNRFNRTYICVLGLSALLVGCTPTAQPGASPVPPVSTTSAPSTPVASTPEVPATPATPAATGTPTPGATAAPDVSGSPAATNGANVPVIEGVAVSIVKPGSGAPLAKGQQANFHYTGWLEGFDSQKKFDSSRDHNPPSPLPLAIGTGQVIPGWDQGLIGMLPGEIRRLEISPEMGYGASGRPPAIPPNSKLYFEVEYVPAP